VDALYSYARSKIDQDENMMRLSEERRKAMEERVLKEHPGCMVRLQLLDMNIRAQLFAQLSGYLLVNRVPGNFHIEARSKHHNFNAVSSELANKYV
jgi:hypothetical protein